MTETSLLNFVVSDGATLITTRYVSNTDAQPATLYYAEGSAFERYSDLQAPQAGVLEPLSPRRGASLAAGSSIAGDKQLPP